MKLSHIAKILGADIGQKNDIEINQINSLENAKEGDISFILSKKYLKVLNKTKASAVLISEDLISSGMTSAIMVKVQDIQKSYRKLLSLFASNSIFEQALDGLFHVSESAELSSDIVIGNFTQICSGAKIERGCRIGSQVFIGENVEIGENVIIYPGVKIYRETVISKNCIIHSNAVLGSDGFGYNREKSGNYEKIPQIGNVILEENVEIGANTVIDRSTFGSTIVGKGVKLDNLIQVAHNVEIGENTVIAAQSGISGSVTLGKGCVVGGQSAFVPHVKIASGSQFQGQSGVGNSIKEENGRYFGTPAIDFINYIRSYSSFKQLPELEKKIRAMENELKELKNN